MPRASLKTKRVANYYTYMEANAQQYIDTYFFAIGFELHFKLF